MRFPRWAPAAADRPLLTLTGAGVIFWMWGFEPYVSNSHFGECRHCQAIQVSAADNVFTQIVAPTAASAQAASAALGPQAGCTAGEGLVLQSFLSSCMQVAESRAAGSK